VFPPGALLEEELVERGWSQVDFAEILGRPVKMVNEVIAGKRAITPETAQGFAKALGTSAEFWLNLENQYRLSQTPAVDDAVERRAAIYNIAPIKEMQRRGWLPLTKSINELDQAICGFFGVGKTADIEELACAAKKSTSYAQPATPSQRAWVRYVRKLGPSVNAKPFSDQRWRDGLDQLGMLLNSPEDVRRVPAILAESGIRLVIVEQLEGSKTDGVCLWLDEKSPVIGLTLRFDRIDSFWFALIHEIDHVFNRDGMENPIVDIDLVGDQAIPTKDKPPEEQRADAFAADFLIAAKELSGFIARVSPLYSKERIRGFAARLKVHPGLVVGQLQHLKEIKYSHSREMLEKVRTQLTGSALTDGWGQQASV